MQIVARRGFDTPWHALDYRDLHSSEDAVGERLGAINIQVVSLPELLSPPPSEIDEDGTHLDSPPKQNTR